MILDFGYWILIPVSRISTLALCCQLSGLKKVFKKSTADQGKNKLPANSIIILPAQQTALAPGK